MPYVDIEINEKSFECRINSRADIPRPGLAKMRAIRMTQKMDCPITNTNYKEMIECLRRVDAKKITKAASEYFVSLNLQRRLDFHCVVQGVGY